jgi:hypothetical protein
MVVHRVPVEASAQLIACRPAISRKVSSTMSSASRLLVRAW